MARLRIPLSLQIVLIFFLASIVPVILVYNFMLGQTRDAYLKSRTDTLDSQARAYSARLESNQGAEQDLTTTLSNAFPDVNYFLLGINGQYLAHSDPSKVGTFAVEDLGVNLTRVLLSRDTTTYTDSEKDLIFATYRRSTTEPAAVAVGRLSARLSPINSLTSSIMTLLGTSILGIGVLLGIASLWLLRSTTQLSTYASELGNGNYSASMDDGNLIAELTPLADNLRSLSAKLQGMIAKLENKILEKTQELDRRANQFKAAADVGKAATSVRVLSELLNQTTRLIHERFGFYHAGIFLLDDRKEYAELKATNSEGGRKMLEKNHKLKVGQTGIVGYVTEAARPRIALDVGQDAVFFDNPDLPETRSEMALPLVAGGQILGALDVQSTEPQAFSTDDIGVLQILADQLAIAIQNAKLFNETENALETARLVYGEVSREAWRRILRQKPRVGYLATPPGAVPIQSETLETSMATAYETGDIVFGSDGLSIVLPIKIRGESIGAIRLRKSEISEAWTQEETNLAIALSDQLSGALESARLYDESQQRAARESLISDISTRISAGTRLDSVIRETVQELGQLMENVKVSFQLTDQPSKPADSEDAMQNIATFRMSGDSRE